MTEMSSPPPQSPSSPLPVGSLADKLRLAASKGQSDKVQDLLQAGAGFEPDRERRTALHYAALNGYVETCKLLLHDRCCDIDAQDVLGYTALHRAASQGHVEVIAALAEEGCTIDRQDEHGNSALHEAAWNGFSKSLEMLVKHNCNVFLANKAGFTALHLTAQNGHNESSRVLLYAACSADLKNNYGDTALHTAARYGHAGVSRILVSARCRMNEQNKNGDTALHIAAALKRRKIAKVLVEAGIDISVKNKQEETAIDVARRKEHPEIILIITSFSRPKSAQKTHHREQGREAHREHPNVRFKDEIQIDIDGPTVVADDQPPLKPDKQEKERRFFFFKKKKKDKDKEKADQPDHQKPASAPAQPWKKPVQGFFSQYVPKTGIQYYRDLAGNIKQGPVGYAPVCQCGPALKKLEHTMETNKENLYDHIDASHQVLKDRIEQLDKRTTQQVYSIDKLTRERMENEHTACRERITHKLRSERRETEQMFNQYNEKIQSWLEAKLSSYGHCLDHHHDDSALPPRNMFFDFHENANGRLFRSRSDETLSQSDYSGKHRKKDFYESRQAAMQQIRGWQMPAYRDSSQRRTKGHVNTTVTQAEVHVRGMDRHADGASPKFEGSPSNPIQRQPPNLKSPSTNSTLSPQRQSPIDIRNYRRDSHNQGAIPKRLPQSHSWQHISGQGKSGTPVPRENSTVVNGSGRSREGSPYDSQPQNRAMARSHTDSGNLSKHNPIMKQNLPERGPPSQSNLSSAQEGPQRPPTSSTGQYSSSANVKQYGSVLALGSSGSHQPQTDSKASRQTWNHEDIYVRQMQPPLYRPRTRSTDTLLADDNETFAQCMTKSKSVERTLDEAFRGGSSFLDKNMNLNPGKETNKNVSSQHRASGDPCNKHGNPYRILNTGGDSTKNILNRNVSMAANENLYANARNTSSRMDNDNQNQSRYQWHKRDSSREGNYTDIGQLKKNKPPYRSMYGIHGDQTHYSHDSGPITSSHSKSENNLTKTVYETMDTQTTRPAKPPPYNYRHATSAVANPTYSASGNYGNSVTGSYKNNTASNYNSSFVGNHNNSGNYTSVVGVYQQNSEDNPARGIRGRTGVYGSSATSNVSNITVTYSSTPNNSSTAVGNSGNYSKVNNNNCLEHDSHYERTTVYNPTYHNNKEDSTCSSNQDSGYSSKTKMNYPGQHHDGVPSNSGTPSSSFSTDRSISTGTPSQNNSPFIPPHGLSDYEPMQTSRQYHQSIQQHVSGWYQKKLLEAAEKLRNSEQYGGAQKYSPTPINYDPVNGSDV